MPTNKNILKNSNVNYIGKDFNDLKSSLMRYAKSYFPNTYKDFNETSPGMMLIEMSAYVGDVLNFYVDRQYQEMLLPLASERRNIINMAKMFGYKMKAIHPAYVTLTVSQEVDAASTADGQSLIPNMNQAFIVRKGMRVSSQTNGEVNFQTLSEIDFTSTGSSTDVVESTFASNGSVSTFTITKKVRAMSAETISKTFNVGTPKKFLKLTLPETNIVEIEKVVDSNNNIWYEVDYLAQDKVPVEKFYYDDLDRTLDPSSGYGDALYDVDGTSLSPAIEVPYSLAYVKALKRFISEVNEDGTTSIIFGNGILHTSQTGSLQDNFYLSQQAGITIPGEPEEYNQFNNQIDFSLGNHMSSLGEAPSNTTLTVHYKVGGGYHSNVDVGDLSTIQSKVLIGNTTKESSLTATNKEPATGGSTFQDNDEIKNNIMANFSTQLRCVTKRDYEARIMSMPAKYGNIAKVYVERSSIEGLFSSADFDQNGNLDMDEFKRLFMNVNDQMTHVPTIMIHILSYDSRGLYLFPPNNLIKSNLKNYLAQYRIITDEVSLIDGKVINFGVEFDVVGHKQSNKSDVKLRCIRAIDDYFHKNKMQFKQPINISDIEYNLMGLEGVRAVNSVTITQDFGEDDLMWDKNSVFPNGVPSTGRHTGLYGYQYDFSQFTDGLILPSLDPSIFELKYPNKNIRGIIR